LTREQKQKQVRLIPNIALDEKTCDRIRCFGKEENSFADILNKLMDVADGTRESSSVIGHKDMIETEFRRRYNDKNSY
jgi:hypothetical protein